MLYGVTLVPKPVLNHLFGLMGFDNVFLNYFNLTILPLIYSLILASCARRKGLLQGFTRFLFIGWLFNIAIFSLSILVSSIKGVEFFSMEGTRLYVTLLFVNPTPLILEAIMPRTAVSLSVYNTVTGATRRAGEEASLSNDEVLRIEIYGESDKISFKAQPDGLVKFSNIVKTHLFSYVDAIPQAVGKTTIEVYYDDRLIRSIDVSVKNLVYRSITFYLYLNDDYIGSSEISVETNKQLIDAVQPVLSAFLSKLGVSSSDITEIQFYTKDKLYIPSSAKLTDLPEINEFVVKIYVIDKIGEFLKYLKKSDVYEIWETLVKRLELLRRRIPDLLKSVEDLKKDLENVVSNWW